MNHAIRRSARRDIPSLTWSTALMLALWQIALAPAAGAETESREIAEFHSVRFEAPGELTLKRTDTVSLDIEAESKVIGRLLTEVVDGVLEIKVAGSEPLRTKQPVRISLGYTKVGELEVSGSGSLKADHLSSPTLKLKVLGSGRLECAGVSGEQMEVSVAGSGGIFVHQTQMATLAMSLSGSGRATLSGAVTSQTVSVTGSGSLRALDLSSRSATVDIAGSGNARVWVEENLNVTVSGSGFVRYRGEPSLRQSIIGSGYVRVE